MTRTNEILERLARIFGDRWWKQSRVVAARPGYVDVSLSRGEPGLFSLCQNRDYKGCGLPAPRIVFRFEQDPAMITVVSWEDCFDHDGPDPVREFRTIESPGASGVTELQEALARRLLEALIVFDDHRA